MRHRSTAVILRANLAPPRKVRTIMRERGARRELTHNLCASYRRERFNVRKLLARKIQTMKQKLVELFRMHSNLNDRLGKEEK